MPLNECRPFWQHGLTCELIPYPLPVLILVSQSALWWYRIDQRLFEHHSPHYSEHYLYN